MKNADELLESLRNFEDKDLFVMESNGFYEPIYDKIESKEFKVKVAKPLKVKLIADSRIKNDKIDMESKINDMEYSDAISIIDKQYRGFDRFI